MTLEIRGRFTDPGVANDKPGRHGQLHGQQPGKAVGLAARTRIGYLIQFKNVSIQNSTYPPVELRKIIFVQATVVLQLTVFLEVAGKQEGGVTRGIAVVALAVL